MTQNEETLLKFPCQFPIKIIGKPGEDFEIAVLTIIRKHIPDIHEGQLKTNASKQGKYAAITVTIEAQSKDQLDQIYLELNQHDLIMMTL